MDIVLEPEVGYVQPIPVESGGKSIQKQFDSLAKIIDDFNKRFGGQFSEEGVNILAEQIPTLIKAKEEDLKYIYNSDKANAKITSDELVKKIMSDLMFTHTDIFKKFSNDDNFKRRYEAFIFDILWSQKGRGGESGHAPSWLM